MGGFNHQGHALDGDFGIPVFSRVFLFLSHHKVGRFAQHHTPGWHATCPHWRPKSKTVTQTKAFLFTGWFSSVFCCINEQLTNTQIPLCTNPMEVSYSAFLSHQEHMTSYKYFYLYFYISFTFPYYFMWRAKEGERHMHATCAVRRQHGSWSSPSAVWILGIKLGSSGLLASACTHWAIGLAQFPQFLINSCLSFNMSPLGSYTLLWAQCAEDQGFLAGYPARPYCQANHPERKRQCLVAPGLTLGLASEALSLQF